MWVITTTYPPTQYLPSSSNGASECKICLLVPLKLLQSISPLLLPHTCPSLLSYICPPPHHPWAMCLMVVRQSPVSVKKKRLIWCHATSHDTRWPQPALNLHLNWGQNSQTGAHSSTTSQVSTQFMGLEQLPLIRPDGQILITYDEDNEDNKDNETTDPRDHDRHHHHHHHHHHLWEHPSKAKLNKGVRIAGHKSTMDFAA